MQMKASQSQYFHHSPMSAVFPQRAHLVTPQQHYSQHTPPQMPGLYPRFQSAATPPSHPMYKSPHFSTSNAPMNKTLLMQGFHSGEPFGYNSSGFYGQMGPSAGGIGQGKQRSGGQSPYGRARAFLIIDPNENAANNAAAQQAEWQRRQQASSSNPYFP